VLFELGGVVGARSGQRTGLAADDVDSARDPAANAAEKPLTVRV
jgi:hypothetical protein